MLGAIIGDIVGSRYEWSNIKTKEFEFLTSKCRPTDDSVMSLAVAKAILDCHGDYTDLGAKAVSAMQEIGRPYPFCGYGGMFYRWMYSDEPKPYGSYGNGAAMRVSACGFAANSFAEAITLSRKVTEVTHDHPEGIKGAEATTAAIYLARTGHTIPEIRDYINRNYYPLDFTLEEIRPTYWYDVTCQGTVPYAITAFLESTGFEDAIRNAISIGGDSDTLAAITGGIAEAYYGVPSMLRTLSLTFLDKRLCGILDEFEQTFGIPTPGERIKENFMIELPITNCMKEHYKQQNATFTDAERATIFWNSDLNITEKLTALREIHDTTTDEALKAQIEKRITMEEETQKAFLYQDSDYVHLVKLDDSDDVDRVFVSLDAAIAYGKEECDETFSIEKEILDDQLPPDADPNTLLGGYASFQKDGTFISCHCYSSRGYEGVFLNAVEPEGFEEAYIPVLNPFEYGDIVHIPGDKRPAIVVTSQKHWNEHKERMKNSKFPLNYYINTITVEFLYSDGEFDHGHPDIFALEKLDHWDNEDEWKLLTSLSKLMKGEGWIETVFENYEKNKR